MIRRVGDDRTEVNFLNVGQHLNISVVAETITITQSFYRIFEANNTDIRNIVGGDTGDILIVYGNKVRFRTGGNILKNTARLNQESLMLVKTVPGWSPFIDP